MTLKAIKPTMKEQRLKMFVYGPAGVGKTIGAIKFPNSYIIDTERGTNFYANIINESNSVVLQTLDPDEIRGELNYLLTEKHSYKTLIIDPITQVYNATQEKWTKRFQKFSTNEMQDFGIRYWGKVKGDFKSTQRLLLALDMNVIVTAHQKDLYSSDVKKIGVTFDSMKGDDYFFDIVFRVERINGDLIAFKIKERSEKIEGKFPDNFVWSYDNFCKFYGKEIIEKDSTPVLMASTEQILRIKQLITPLKDGDELIAKWFTKSGIDDWSEMNSESIQKCIDYLENKKV